MRQRWPVTLVVFLIVLAALGYGLWFLLSEDALLREESRAEVPGTNLTVVVYKDEKNLSRYRLFADGEQASGDARIFGGYGDVAELPLIERGRHWVRMMWNTESGLLFIDFDLGTCQVLRDTNESGPLPVIAGCRRTD